MWDQPYLETCCRAALHRLCLCGEFGRPPGVADAPCLQRLAAMGLCRVRCDQYVEPTPQGKRRHLVEILKIRNDKVGRPGQLDCAGI